MVALILFRTNTFKHTDLYIFTYKIVQSSIIVWQFDLYYSDVNSKY